MSSQKQSTNGMSKIHNIVGSLTTLKSHLEENNIYEFRSLNDVINFQNTYTESLQKLIAHHENLIDEEKNLLNTELKLLEKEIEIRKEETEQRLLRELDELKYQYSFSVRQDSKNIFQKISKALKIWNYERKISFKESAFQTEVRSSVNHLVNSFQDKFKRYQFISSNLDEAINLSAHSSLSELKRKKAIIDNLNSFIYGAIGELKVVNELKKLSDQFFVINDFSISFSTAIYNRNENNYIKSIQIDHILVAPSGIFLIETKNWSEKSIENLSLRSPVEQIKRTSFVLFILLNSGMSDYHLGLDIHHWGDKKIPIKNLIVMTNKKPKGEFLYVKVLTISELLGYINYFNPIFSLNETQRITDYLLRVNEQKVLDL